LIAEHIAALVERIAGPSRLKGLQPRLKVLQHQLKGSKDILPAAQRFNIVAAQVESIPALAQRFKNIATQVVSAAQRF
jgi:hypothetical protein